MESPVRLLELRVYQQTSDEQIIGWAPVGLDLDNVQVDIYARYAESANDEALVLTTTASARFVRITGLRLRDQWRVVFYRILLTDPDGKTREYQDIHLDGDKSIGPVKNLRLNMRTLLRQAGDPVLVYQRVGGKGTRCSCYDSKLKKLTRSNCPECFNTGWVNGFYPPILTLGQIIPEVHNTSPGDTERQDSAVQIMLAEYPEVRPRDMVYEVGTGRRYRVGPIQTSEYNRQLVNQTFTGTLLNVNNVEHNVPVPDPDTLTPVMSRVDAPRGRRTLVVANIGEAIKDVKKKI